MDDEFELTLDQAQRMVGQTERQIIETASIVLAKLHLAGRDDLAGMMASRMVNFFREQIEHNNRRLR